tara:strand:- start:3277 stop:4440 length:1164 start_codon:yes stop_codon:yes gene_type:complete
MIYSIRPKKDTTIYEWTSSINTGIDEVLEIEKIISSSGTTDTYNSRILMKFDLSEISQSVSNGQITSPKYYLNLYTLSGKSLAYKYGLEAFPVSQSWDMGKGRRIDRTTIGGVISHDSEGASWTYRDGEQYFGTQWASQSAAGSQLEEGTTGSFCTTVGGGTWYVGSGSASQSFDYEDTDVRMDVTDIVDGWLNGTITSNEGFIIMRSGSTQPGVIDEERNGKPYGSLQFFSMDTHTIYEPKLEVSWEDRQTTNVLSVIDVDSDNIVDIRTKGTYKKSDRAKIQLIARPKFPEKTYVTQSEALTKYRLPKFSYWSVKDMVTEETVIPFDSQSTWMSNDSDGSYFNLWMNQFYEERRYKFVFKTLTGDYEYPTTERIYDNDYTFKVIR